MDFRGFRHFGFVLVVAATPAWAADSAVTEGADKNDSRDVAMVTGVVRETHTTPTKQTEGAASRAESSTANVQSSGAESVPATADNQSTASIQAGASSTSNPISGTVTRTVRPGEYQPTAKQLQEWNKPIKGFHPIKRIVRPIWKLRQEAMELQDHIVALQKPMNGLQPAFTSLEGKMAGVDMRMSKVMDQLAGVNGSLSQLTQQMSKIDDELPTVVTGVREDIHEMVKVRQDIQEISKIRADIHQMGTQMRRLEVPLKQLQAPMAAVIKPLSSVESHVSGVSSQMSGVQSQIADMQQEVGVMSKQMQELKEPMMAVAVPLSEVRGQLKELNSLLLTLLCVTVLFGSAAVVASFVGLVMAYRLRHKFFPTEKSP
ncbi:MAG TPA: hypothetical protein V6D17_24930 [Candidatus Obscuribacterales bacterium]